MISPGWSTPSCHTATAEIERPGPLGSVLCWEMSSGMFSLCPVIALRSAL